MRGWKLIFLDRINEARPVWSFYRLAPAQVVGGYLYAAFALAMCALRRRPEARRIVIVFSAVALMVATFQYRGTASRWFWRCPVWPPRWSR
ncbi:MAG: hypothetical protein U1E93_12715 [Alphaproteobacteria bacterium]